MTAFLYVVNTLADWEIGYLTAELISKRYFASQNAPFNMVKFGNTLDPIITMGGMTITPEMTLDSITFTKEDTLILPGGNLWMEKETELILMMAKGLIERGINVAAICGATVGLARVEALNHIKHTSNDKDYLKMICPQYTGEELYLDLPAVRDSNLITASGLAAVDFTYEVLKMLKVFKNETLEAWHALYTTKQSKYFYDLMKSMKS